MSNEDNPTITLPRVEEVQDPIQKLVNDFITESFEDLMREGYAGVELSFESLESVILNCFDSVQEVMLASVLPENTTIH